MSAGRLDRFSSLNVNTSWVLVLVYIGAVIVLFLFGIMITRAPTGPKVEVDHRRRSPAAMAAFLMFIVTAGSALTAFGDDRISNLGGGTSTEAIGEQLLQLVARSINDLYFRLSVTDVSVNPLSVVKGIAAGVGAAVVCRCRR